MIFTHSKSLKQVNRSEIGYELYNQIAKSKKKLLKVFEKIVKTIEIFNEFIVLSLCIN